jgi:hypothetical protein
MAIDAKPVGDWPGKGLGLPEDGPRSIARIGRRILALAIDWALALAIGSVLFAGDRFAILGVFAAMQVVSIAVLSGSVGHLLAGLRVVPVKPAWIGVLRPLFRTLLLCLVIPALIWDRDQRGLHDVLSGTVLVRR